MSNSRRIFAGAAIAAWVGALGASGALAQDNSTIGPPQLRDFQLPGQRTTTPRAAGPVDDSPDARAPAAPPSRTAPPVVSAPIPGPAVAPPPPTASPPRPSATATPRRDQPSSQSAAPRSEAPAAPQPGSQPSSAPTPTPAPPTSTFTPTDAPALPTASRSTAPDAAPEASEGWSPLWLALPLLLLAAGAAFLFRRRRRDGEEGYPAEETEEALETPPAAAPEWQPATARVAAPAALGSIAMPSAQAVQPAEEERAWLEVEFKPSRAAATDKEAIVHYELLLRNVGKTTAGNIRIDTKLFNAGAEGEIRDFLGGPIHEQSGSPHVTIRPGEELRLGSTIAMSKEDVREIVVEGRSLFVPAVAINVAYNWAPTGAGRTSKSWLVGREAEQPSQKMGAFRLDLGPRIYRSVGQRQTGLTQMV